jgi:hypothetical protein
VKRPKCSWCKGTGKTSRLSFVDAKNRIEDTCKICRGDGKAHHTIDLYEVLDYLRGVGSGAFTAAAIGIERKFLTKPDDEGETR